MYISVSKKTQIVGIDFSYSTKEERMVSIYFTGYNSMVVEPGFVDLVTMLNGMHTIEQVRNYMIETLDYSLEKCKTIEEKILSWGIIEKTKYPLNWGTPINTRNFKDNFKKYSIIIRQFDARYIDLLLMLAKYGLALYKIDRDFIIDDKMFKDSLMINKCDIGKSVSQLLAEKYDVNVLVGECISERGDFDEIVVCDSGKCIVDEASVIMDISDYSELNICEYGLFSTDSLKDELCRKFSVNFNILNDIIFGITNGFYS